MNGLAKRFDVEIMFENLKLPSYLKEGFKIVGSFERLFFTLDMGHDLKNNSGVEEFFLEYNSKKIKHVHIHDFDGKSDHIALGSGFLDVFKKMELIRKLEVYAVIEVKKKDELVKSVEFLRNKKIVID